MKNRFIALLGILFFSSFSLLGQMERERLCGLSQEDLSHLQEVLIKNKQYLKINSNAKSRNKTIFIPVKYHLIASSSGTGRVKYQDVLNQHCLLNKTFAQYNITFYIKDGFNLLDNNQINEDTDGAAAEFKMRQERDQRAINIWIVKSAQNSNELGRILGYWTPVFDWIVLDKTFVNGNGKTLLHELGHFFGLLHTFHGWDFEPYDPSSPESLAPASSPRGFSTEYADGSNCNTAGDMICDTPADYNSGFFWQGIGCNYNETILDPNGAAINPDEELLMSYFSDECIKRFTPEQAALISADYERPGRNFLRIDNFTPNSAEITTTPKLLAPIERAVTSSFNQVYLKWEAVPGADTYLLEVDRSGSFNIDNFKFITNKTTFLLEDLLDDDKIYRWRITPFNDSYTCAPPSETAIFRTGISTSVSAIETVNDWTIQPNPIREQTFLTVSIHAKETFEANLTIFNLTGQSIKTISKNTFPVGNSTLKIDIKDLAKGIYFVSLKNKKGILNKKLIVN